VLGVGAGCCQLDQSNWICANCESKMNGRNNKKSDSNMEAADVVGNACAPSRNRRVTDLLGLVTASATLATIPQSTVPAWRS
jgi:hypothetical protein